MKRLPLTLLLLLALLLSPLSAIADGAAGKMVLGVGEHLWGADKSFVDRSIDAAVAAKLKVIRWDAPWKAVEVSKGEMAIPPLWDYVVDRARRRGIDSMLILDYGNPHYDNSGKPLSDEAIQAFARYAEFTARHFAGRVPYFEIWNEWDGHTGKTRPGTAAAYAKLVRAVYPRVKAAAPASTVVVGAFDTSAADSLVDYAKRKNTLVEYLEIPGIASYADAFSIHPYVVYRNGSMRTFEGFELLLKRIVQRIRTTPGMETKPIIISELGWSTAANSGRGVTEAEQLDFTTRAIQISQDLGIALLLLYELRDESTKSEDTESAFGLLRYDWSPKPVYQHLAR